MKTLKRASLIFISVVLAVAVSSTALAFAQDFNPQDIQDTAQTIFGPQANGEDGPQFRGRGGRRGQRGGGNHHEALADALGITVEALQAAKEEVGRGRDIEAFAEALGVSVEELETAMEQVKAEALQQALENGDITQEQYEQKLAMQALKDYIDRKALLADVLGISVEDLEAAKEAGQRLPELIDELGLDMETVKAEMEAAHEAAIQQAVVDGIITQEQAEQILSGEGPGFGGKHGRNGRGGSRGPQDRTGTGFNAPNTGPVEQF